MERTYIDTLAQLIARSPTCYHAAATAAELLALAGSTDDPGFSPVSTTVMVENGQIRQILRIFLP